MIYLNAAVSGAMVRPLSLPRGPALPTPAHNPAIAAFNILQGSCRSLFRTAGVTVQRPVQ